MSAYIVANDHSNALINLAISGPRDAAGRWYPVVQEHAAQATGQMLMNENVKSVDYRYKESNAPRVFTWDPDAPRPGVVEGFKAIAGYVYQACEHPDFAGSAAQDFCQQLRARLASVLPGYEEANSWHWLNSEHGAGVTQ